MEDKREVKVYLTRFMCLDCQKEKGFAGEFKPTEKTLLTKPPKYEHKCTTCERTLFLDKFYPITEYEIVPEW